MFAQRTAQIVVEYDGALAKTLDALTRMCNRISEIARNHCKPLSALDLHRTVYDSVKGVSPAC